MEATKSSVKRPITFDRMFCGMRPVASVPAVTPVVAVIRYGPNLLMQSCSSCRVTSLSMWMLASIKGIIMIATACWAGITVARSVVETTA